LNLKNQFNLEINDLKNKLEKNNDNKIKEKKT